jgi:hypothetical protein
MCLCCCLSWLTGDAAVLELMQMHELCRCNLRLEASSSSSSSSHQAIASTPSAPRPTGAVTTGSTAPSLRQVVALYKQRVVVQTVWCSCHPIVQLTCSIAQACCRMYHISRFCADSLTKCSWCRLLRWALQHPLS